MKAAVRPFSIVVPGQNLAGLLWAPVVLAYAGYAIWLFAHPAVLPSDDALFFSRALTHFEILDFAPQFPGYPGFVALGRLFLPLAHGDPVTALYWLTVVLALALPPLAALVVARKRPNGAIPAFVLMLAMPLLPDLALGMLSDGSGIAFLLLGLAVLPPAGQDSRLAPGIAGLAIGWAGCCRPSDAALLAGAFLPLVILVPRWRTGLIVGAGLVVVPTLAVLYALEGPLYLWAGTHFVAGHTTGWGNTMFSRTASPNWFATIGAVPGAWLIAAAIAFALVRCCTAFKGCSPRLVAIAGALTAHLVWTLVMQNPQSLRHLAPVVALGGLLVVLAPWGGRMRAAVIVAMLAGESIALASTLDFDPSAPPPIARAIAALHEEPGSRPVAVNSGVALLRETLSDRRVYDMQYPAHATAGMSEENATAGMSEENAKAGMSEEDAAAGGAGRGGYRLSTTPPTSGKASVFRGRMAGEATMYLYRFQP
ncbi:hypothetical protein [Pararhizobium mangrovi]|uniref:DUF2029 domain-containing protein n=1 Tax=Pararhizobium mangrovi TaxID=2590452 RepID=A0A506UHL6_9HYPH|nr:hypothetical protein [Pararhizobium mangrovi]TPW32801.1 hypothetical protein FJU11_00825 [Pararhizobium mangrovi]